MKKQELELDIDGHLVKVFVYGDIKKPTILYVHGGPGIPGSETLSNCIDYKNYSLVIFHQRGCGESKPFGKLKNNTTWDIVDDIENIRKHIIKSSFIIYGNSWGATPALCYCIEYPQYIDGILLQSLFLGSKKEVEWIYRGAAQKYPDYFKKQFSPFLFNEDLSSFFKHFLQCFLDGDVDQATKWCAWELFLALGATRLFPLNKDFQQDFLNCATIQAFYYLNHCFLKSDYILKNIRKIKSIPMVVVHGTKDKLCSLSMARKLCEKHQNCILNVVDMYHFPTDFNEKKILFKQSIELLKDIS